MYGILWMFKTEIALRIKDKLVSLNKEEAAILFNALSLFFEADFTVTNDFQRHVQSCLEGMGYTHEEETLEQ